MRMLIAFVACAVSFWIEVDTPDGLVRWDEAVRDAFLRIGISDQRENRLTVIDIGETALREIAPWPWPRDRLAELSETLLGHYNGRIVALDIVFPEAGDKNGDKRLGKLAAEGKLVLAQILDYSERTPPLADGWLTGGAPPTSPERLPHASGFIANHADLAVSARCTGNIGYRPDADGVLRHLPVQTEYGGKSYSHLALSILDCAEGGTIDLSRQTSAKRNGLWRIPYRYSLDSYTVVPAEEVLNQNAPRELFEGRYLLVGSSALGLGDRVSTPITPLTPGLFVHAQSLSALLDLAGKAAPESTSGHKYILSWAATSILAASLMLSRLPPLHGVTVIVSFAILWFGVAYAVVKAGIEGSITAPLGGYLVMLIVAIPYEWRQSQQIAKRLLDVFSHYVAKPVLNELMRQGAVYSLNPTHKQITVLVADMEGYTRTTSSLRLEEAATLTKTFLNCLTLPVLARQGTLDKYTGDGLVAFWGAPLPSPHQADEAASAALEILHEVDLLNECRGKDGHPPVRVRIGIESGEALVGDLGTQFRSTYTAVGDCINFASRLEAEATNLRVQVVIGPVAKQLMTRHKTIPLGKHPVRGTSTEINLFALETNISTKCLKSTPPCHP